ncbi:MAG: metal ABC transporter substrate-binding protein, partial [Vicinamibacterales bacterium]
MGLGMTTLSLLVASLTSCGGDGGAEGRDGRVKVITTLPLFADFVRQIGGDRVEVSSLVPTGADPHTWEPSPDDIRRVSDADIAFANGLDLEPSAVRVIEANIEQDTPFIMLADSILLGPVGRGESDNPHLWLDVRGADVYARVVADALGAIDEANVSTIEENKTRYSGDLRELDEYVKGGIATISEDRRKLITTHDAFEYLGRAYGLEVVAVVADSPGQEPSPEDVADIGRAIEREGVPAVFVEPQAETESEILRQAGEDAGVQVCALYSDSLDDKVTNYIELMRFNADELARCLGDSP